MSESDEFDMRLYKKLLSGHYVPRKVVLQFLGLMVAAFLLGVLCGISPK